MTEIFQRLRARFERGKGFGRRRAAGADGHAVAHRTADHFTMDIGRNDELTAHPGERIDLFRFQYRTCANQRLVAVRINDGGNALLPLWGIQRDFNRVEPGVNHRANMRQRLVGRNTAQMAISGSLVCHCMSDAPYTSLKCRVARHRRHVATHRLKGLLVARGQRCSGDKGDGVLMGHIVAHTGDLCANQQTREKFADLFAGKCSQHMRGANFKSCGNMAGVLRPRSRPAVKASAEFSCGGKPAPINE